VDRSDAGKTSPPPLSRGERGAAAEERPPEQITSYPQQPYPPGVTPGGRSPLPAVVPPAAGTLGGRRPGEVFRGADGPLNQVAAKNLLQKVQALPLTAPSPEPIPDGRATLLAGLLGGWQTLDEAAAELRVTSTYLWELVQAGQLRAWALPGAPAGTPNGVRLRREDVLGLLQPLMPAKGSV
jgi:hypothetical protein